MGTRVPCYNRETIFDEEWQQHMKDVHGVFLLWPDSWMRRVEVLDLVGALSPLYRKSANLVSHLRRRRCRGFDSRGRSTF
jgi:hypothetical protein